MRLNKIMSKLLTRSKCLQLNCYQIQQLLAIVKNSMVKKKHFFEHAKRFHISHFKYHLITIIIIIHHRSNLLTFSQANIKLYYIYAQNYEAELGSNILIFKTYINSPNRY